MTQSQGLPGVHTDILLESGTNELEVLVFSIGGQSYGVNVAKVREVILPVTVAASPNQPQCVLGMFNLRGKVLPLVDLHKYLNIQPASQDKNHRRIIVTEFNGAMAAFQVEGVEQIYRMSWSAMRSVPAVDESHASAVTGVTEIGKRLILMLDFESIFDHISLQEQLHLQNPVENPMGVQREKHLVVLAEDSRFIRNLMRDLLTRSGYTRVECHGTGSDALASVQKHLAEGQTPTVLISDIEMPQMDGLALTRRIKENPQSKVIPVVLFSSLITDDTRHKGRSVGADDQIAKPQLRQLVEIVDRWAAKAA